MPLLGELYQAVSAENALFWWVGDRENWENVFCAIEDGKMVAKGQVGIINVIPPGCAPNCKHHIYVNLKAVPHRERDYGLLDELYQVLYERAVVLMRTLPKTYETYLCVGNYVHESANNAFFTEKKGFQPLENLYAMKRSLEEPIPALPLDDRYQNRLWRIESAEEEVEYLKLEAEIWPEAPLGLERLREYKGHSNWIAMNVLEKDTIVGSTMAWQEEGDGVIEDVFVREPWRRRGIAKYLLCRAMSYLQAHGSATVKLQVKAANDTALSLYQSVGFAKDQEEHRFYLPLEQESH
ncbi:GNAT family N-acetyltransferase [Paenibacillus sp. FSL H8-0457]|uniref:GNAT family N-acetyltransferase n=1 Tax=unclassified Paenibacillus TaxID=185978 RepID=UPI0003E260CA|nr:GNAT family N-acetyltransferase [Paenibacillus sp. FSL H8-457]ETT60154.1 GCN5-like N-acetyltransferase [Paenibacillus sp. FSL H8-457]